tara:strand:+ start:1055 stop:1312 length:258 start_codon:yes stop_codon:yes gene_type:complete
MESSWIGASIACFKAGLSGNSALGIQFEEDANAAVYQGNRGSELGRKEWIDGKRSLISIEKGNNCVVSFLAKSESGSGSIIISFE